MSHRLSPASRHRGALGRGPVLTLPGGSYFLWTSVSVTPCSVTLKCTRVGVGSVSISKVEEMAFWTAGAPVSVSTFTELRYKTLQTARTAQSAAQHGASITPCSPRHHPAELDARTRVRSGFDAN